MSKSLSQEIRALIEQAHRAQPFRPHTPVGAHEPTVYMKTPMERAALLPLSTTTLPEVTNGSARFKAGPPAAPAGQVITMSASLAASSRIAQAGARLIVLPDSRTAISDLAGGIAMQEIPF